MGDARQLYGITNDQPATAIEWNEHAVVNGVAGKKVFGITLPPTAQTNPSLVLGYDGVGNLTTITKTINSVDYQKTLSYDGVGNLTNVSVWVQI